MLYFLSNMSLIGYTAAGNSLNLSYLPPSFVYRFMWRQYASLAYSHNRDARGHGITWRANANVLLRPQYTLVVRVTPDPVTRIMWQASRESRLTSVLCVYIDESGRYDRFKEFPAAVYPILCQVYVHPKFTLSCLPPLLLPGTPGTEGSSLFTLQQQSTKVWYLEAHAM